jgi:hypothetical protein
MEPNVQTQITPKGIYSEAPELQWWGEFLFGGSGKQIVIGQNADSRLEVFYVGTNNDLYHRWQLTPNGLIWSAETRFPSDSAQQIAVGRNADGRLEIFYVGTNNDLYHNWQVAPNGGWAGETRFPGDSAKQVAVGNNADGRLEIFYVGTNNDLYHNWQVAPNGAWAGETRFPSDSAQQIAVGRNADGRLEIFYVGTNNDLYHNWQVALNGNWAGETRFPSDSAQQIAVGRNADGRLEIFYVGTNNDLYHNWQVAPNGGWAGETRFPNNSAKQVAVGANASGALEIFYVGTNNDLYHNWQVQPIAGFGSSENYFFYDNCKPLLGVSITINVTQDIVCQSVAYGPQMGFGFQLNCYSPANELSAWQQYVLALFGSTIEGAVDNWPVSGNNIINSFWDMGSLPGKVPAGYKLIITLENDTDSNIIGAIYTVLDNNGKTVSRVDKKLSDIGGNSSKIAPIIAFQLNLVGPVNSEAAVLSSGAGTFVYQATNSMTALTSEPQCAESGYITAETANSLYDSLPGAASTTFTQGFHVSLTEAPARKRFGIIRPRTIYKGPVK